MPRLLIDGYNLIPALPSLGRLARRDLEAARTELLDLLEAYRTRAPSRPSIVVVFDGRPGVEQRKESHRPGIEVRFSRGETADDLILRLLRGGKRGATLVTSDRALAAAARDLTEVVLRSGEFAARVLARMERDPTSEFPDDPEDEERPSRTTRKKGNPRRPPKKERLKARRLRRL